MASNYPTSLDSFNNPSGTDSLNSPSHSLQHSDINDAVEALETKIGIGDSPAGSATIGQVLTAQSGGTAIWATPALVHIETQSFTSVSSFSFSNDVFTSTYKNYLVVCNVTTSGAGNMYVRLRAAGSDATGANYNTQNLQASQTSVSGIWSTGNTFLFIGTGFTGRHSFDLNIYRPQLAEATNFNAKFFNVEPRTGIIGGQHTLATAYDSLTIYPSTGNFSGEAVLYGYKN